MYKQPWLIALLLLAVGLAACGASPVEQAERRWQEAAVEDYRIQVREMRSIWCLYDAALEVRGGQVVNATVTAQPGPAQDCALYVHGVIGEPVPIPPEGAQRWTVEGLFETAHALSDQMGDKDLDITLEFDPDLGYPRVLARDHTQMYDDDWRISVALEVLEW